MREPDETASRYRFVVLAIVAPLIFGLVTDALASFTPGWYGLAAAMAVAVLLLAGVREPRQGTWH